ncbi:MAG: dihydrofolate reductase family protein [Candidatus Wallbacteria bacterium]|nr:dihydrofolate reductase family protein [Candidatus Wallbacteria bacterium]
MRTRPETTLFLMSSIDGKISTGDTDFLDFDKDFPAIHGIREGLDQYYAIEQKTDLASLNSGRTWAKIGLNEPAVAIKRLPVTFVVIDNKPHLNETGVLNALARGERLILVTSNAGHPAYSIGSDNRLELIYYPEEIDFPDLFMRLRHVYGVEYLTIQTGGTLNALLLRSDLIDHLNLVVAPCLIGGSTTPTLIDGEALHSLEDLVLIRPAKLVKCEVLHHSFICLKYDLDWQGD